MPDFEAVLNRLCKWRNYYASWQVGRYAKGEREFDAIADHRELSILLRVELTSVVSLLIEKGVFTVDEFVAKLDDEGVNLMEIYCHSHPGVFASGAGLHITDDAPDFMTKGIKDE